MFTAIVRGLAGGSIIRRSFSTCQVARNAQKSPLYQLRQTTGLAYNLCREALNKHDNDVEQAKIWLQAQALAHGLQKATKVGSRATKEGLVSLAVGQDNKSLLILQLNCETDFVAKNQIFKDFTIDLTEEIAHSHDSFTNHETYAEKKILELVADERKLEEISQKIAPVISKLGENIRVQRLSYYKSTCNNTNIYGNIHARVGQRDSKDFDIVTGRFGALVALKYGSNAPAKSIGNTICYHVIGYNPTYIELPEELRKSLEKAEKEKAEREKAEKAEEEKAKLANEQEGEQEGEPDSELEELTRDDSRDDWPSIMDQQLVMTDQKVRDFCSGNDIEIVYFKRFECQD